MDRLYHIRRVSREMATYSMGLCHVCKQGNVKVRRLACGKHNYCRVCLEFVPRLIKGDFTCKACTTRRGIDVPKRQDDVDVLLSSKTGPCDVGNTFAKGVNALVAFDEPNDDSDLDGNNTEWDYLLQSVDEKAKDKRNERQTSWISNSENLDAPPPNDAPGMIPRKRSYVRLGPSSTLFGTRTTTTAENQSFRKSSTIRIVDPSRDRFSRRSSDGSKSSNLNKIVSRGLFRPDPLELERGTSPCKGHRRNNSFNSDGGPGCDLTDYLDPSVSETEQLREQIGDIEGPAFTSSSASGSEESLVFSPPHLSTNIHEFEEFWDRK